MDRNSRNDRVTASGARPTSSVTSRAPSRITRYQAPALLPLPTTDPSPAVDAAAPGDDSSSDAPPADDTPVVEAVKVLIGDGMPRMDAIKLVARRRGLSKRDVYDQMLTEK